MATNRKTNAELQEELNALNTRLINERVNLARFRLLAYEIPIERYSRTEYRETLDSLYQSLNQMENII